MIDRKLHQLQLCLFCIPCGTTLGWTGNCLWEMLRNQRQCCDGAVYQYIAMICCQCRPIFTWQPRNPLVSSLVNFFHFVVLESCERCVWAWRWILMLSSQLAIGFPSCLSLTILTHWGRGLLNCLNAHSRGLNNVIQLLNCVSLKIYDKFANYFCELKFSGNTHQRP